MKSSAQLQRDAQAQRAQLSATLDQLGESLQPSHLTTEVLTLAKDSGLSIAKSLAESARANPVPALLIGVGLTMLLTRDSTHSGSDLLGKAGDMLKSMTSSGASAVRHAGESIGKMAGNVTDTAREAAGTVRDKVSSATETAREAAGTVRDKVSGAIGSAKHATEDAAHRVGAEADSLRASAGHAVEEQVEGARRALHDGEDQARHLIEDGRRRATEGLEAIEKLAREQPILLAALGAALGAVAGSLFPVTEAEKKYMGDVSKKAADAGRETLARVADVVKNETLGDRPENKVAEVADKLVHAVTKDIVKPVVEAGRA
jgi:hypothetical protein